MRKLLTLTLMLLLSGCGSDIDPKYRFNVDSFVAEGKFRGVDVSLRGLTVKKRDPKADPCPGTNEGYVGCCSGGGFMGFGSTISITDSEYESGAYSDLEKKMIIYHELGHCVLGRAHTSGVAFGSAPDSIMNAHGPNDWQIRNYWDYYMTELFAKQ